MVFPKPQPSKPTDTGFTIRSTETTLEIHPPEPGFKRQPRGKVPLALLLLMLLGVTVVVIRWIQLLITAGFWWLFLLPLGYGLLGSLPFLEQKQRLSKPTHLYFDARQRRFKIVQRSLKSNEEKMSASGLISDIQNVTASLHDQGRYGAYRSITIHAKQPLFIDWRLTSEEAFWIIHEIQLWLSSQQEKR